MPLEAVEARRLYRQVADQLRALIDSGEYRVGSRLPTERDLAEQLKVSRPTVREALIALEVEGRVRIRVGSGIYVSEPAALAHPLPAATEIEGPFELLRAREFLEGAIAEQAARVATPDDIARIDASLDAMATAQHPGEASMIHDRAFHVAVTQASGEYSAEIGTNAGIWSHPEYSPPVRDDAGELQPGQIAYLRARNLNNSISETAEYDLVVADRDGSNDRIVFPPDSAQPGLTSREFAWSPDGQALAVTYQGSLWRVDISADEASQLTLDGGASRPVWSR